jgi:ABC-type methionine transport system ATPase subunit
MEPMIQVENLCKSFSTKSGTVEAARNISFSIEKGEIFGIIGLSGAGKSTLVRCLNLLERPTSGSVWVNGKNLTELSERELRKERQNIGMIFQHFNLLMQRTALDNVCFPMEIVGISKKEARKKALEYLKIVGLEEKALSYPSQLSGGQKQRVAIARVLASDPEILLCDEATSALDPQTTKSILELIRKINKEYGITVVVITHEMSVVQEICNRVAVLERGVLVESGTVEELFRSPKTEAARRLVFSGRAQIQKMNGKRLVRVTFKDKSSFEPVIANLVLTYRTPVNILYADTKNIGGAAEGEMILQLPEIEETAEKMIEYLRETNMGVEELSSDVG